MRRIIYAWNYVEWGGAQIHFLALIKVARKEFETVVILPDGTNPQFLGFLEMEGIRYGQFQGNVDIAARSKFVEKLRRHWKRVKSEFAMLKKLEEVGIDAAVHTDISPAQSLLSLVWLCLRTNVFITLHNALAPVPRWRWAIWKLKFGLISRFDNFHVFCTNEHAASYFRRLFSKRVAEDIKVTYDSIDPVEIDRARTASFDRNKVLEDLRIPVSKFLVLAVGQFVDRKGRWTFLEAAKLIKAKTEEMAFVWVSPTIPEGEDAKRVESFDLGDSFHLIRSDLLGTERLDILKFFRAADLFVLPSYVEGVPIALLEAMAIGLPCISTSVYGIPEAIINGKTGLLIEAGDAKALSESIMQLSNKLELRSQLADHGRHFVMTKFDERLAAATVVEAYCMVIHSEQ